MTEKTLTEVLRDYQNSIERSLAGAITGKKDDELDNSDIESAQQIAAKTTDSSYMALANALDIDDAKQVQDIVHSINPTIKFVEMRETNLLDRDMLESAGFTYAAIVPQELTKRISDYLDENEIDYMDDGTGNYQLKLGDRESAYKIGRGLNKMLTASHIVRDSKEEENKTKKKIVKRHRTGLAGIQQTGSGPHTAAKYTKQDRRGGKHRKEFNSGDE